MKKYIQLQKKRMNSMFIFLLFSKNNRREIVGKKRKKWKYLRDFLVNGYHRRRNGDEGGSNGWMDKGWLLEGKRKMADGHRYSYTQVEREREKKKEDSRKMKESEDWYLLLASSLRWKFFFFSLFFYYSLYF